LRIPKVIHCFWFGKGGRSEKIIRCIESWKTHSPDYRIIEWNEDSFDVNSCVYSKEAYANKKYAFVSDYARLKVLYEYGGFYLDTDVWLLKPLDSLLNHSVFMGFESKTTVAPGLIIGAQSGNEFIGELLSVYEHLNFVYKDRMNLTTIGEYATARLLKRGLRLNGEYQELGPVTIYPTNFFCPLERDTGHLDITPDTYSVHLYDASWKPDGYISNFKTSDFKLRLKLRLLALLGEKTFFRLIYLLR